MRSLVFIFRVLAMRRVILFITLLTTIVLAEHVVFPPSRECLQETYNISVKCILERVRFWRPDRSVLETVISSADHVVSQGAPCAGGSIPLADCLLGQRPATLRTTESSSPALCYCYLSDERCLSRGCGGLDVVGCPAHQGR